MLFNWAENFVMASREAGPAPIIPVLEPQNHEIGKFYAVQDRRATCLKAPKLQKGRSGGIGPIILIA